MRLIYFLKRIGNNKKVLVLTILFFFAIVFSILHLSYALFSVHTEKGGAFTIVVGELDYEYQASMLDQHNQITVPAGRVTIVPFTISNNSDVPIDYKILYQLVGQDVTPSGLKIGTIGAIQEGNVTSYPSHVSKTVDVIMINTSETSFTIQFDFVAGLVGASMDIGEKRVVDRGIRYNTNIFKVYQYDENRCITGEESTCVELIERPDEYEPGTIIKYRVNDKEERYFHVISDNEDGTLTMQERENTINATKWYDVAADNSKGPLTILPLLENATKDWTNVKDQKYTMGTTIFKDNPYTGCSFSECTVNTYTMPERIGKARMITVQEAISLGCSDVNQSCPIWMHNYLKDNESYGGTVNHSTDYGYWTMSAESIYDKVAMSVFDWGAIGHYQTLYSNYGARAVVVIDK